MEKTSSKRRFSDDELLNKSIKLRGTTWHLIKLAEECNELSAAILQWITKQAPVENILAEVGDVELSMAALQKIFGDNGRLLIDKSKEDKQLRVEKKIIELEARA